MLCPCPCVWGMQPFHPGTAFSLRPSSGWAELPEPTPSLRAAGASPRPCPWAWLTAGQELPPKNAFTARLCFFLLCFTWTAASNKWPSDYTCPLKQIPSSASLCCTVTAISTPQEIQELLVELQRQAGLHITASICCTSKLYTDVFKFLSRQSLLYATI